MSGDDHGRYQAEVRERWGDTAAYRESSRRTREYTREDWAEINEELEGIESGLAAAMSEGEAPDGARAVELAEAARRHIDRWYYPCSRAMHAQLAEMYTADPRFEAPYEDRAEGLAAFVAAALRANAARG
jgi:hypothetical protein